MSVSNERGRIIQMKSETFHPDCRKITVKFAAGLMVWGCILSQGVGNLFFTDGTVNAAKYQQILANELLSIQYLQPDGDFIFQQDEASCHIT